MAEADAAHAAHSVHLTPVRGRDRIEVLDVVRGIAILGIFYMNIPFMAGPVFGAAIGNFRAMGWSGADQVAWVTIQTFWDGTQRGLLEFLFGAGLMVTAAKAMHDDGPVAVADLYIRRNLWLLGFGLFDIFCLLWPGDILHIYALCALALFPFRRLSVRWLIPLGLLFSAFTVVTGGMQYYERVEQQSAYAAASAKAKAGTKLTAEEGKAVEAWQKLEKRAAGEPDAEFKPQIAAEAKARNGSFIDYAGWLWSAYMFIYNQNELFFGVFEAFCAMLLGIALWKKGVIQGKRTTREYLVLMVGAYALGMGARYIGCMERMTFLPIPKTFWITSEVARLLVSLGHLCAINLLVRGATSRTIVAPFRAAGQMAFSLYFMEQIAGLWIMFSPIGMHLPGAQGWAHLALQATIVVAILLVFANLWMRAFVSGPLEWIWRSLSYGERQPFRRAGAMASPALAT